MKVVLLNNANKLIISHFSFLIFLCTCALDFKKQGRLAQLV